MPWHIEGVSVYLAVHEDNPLEELLASSLRGISYFPSIISKKNYASAIRLRAQAQLWHHWRRAPVFQGVQAEYGPEGDSI
jgi:hypothetical protein